MRRLRGESGAVTLTELVVSMSIYVVVMAAVLGIFDTFIKGTSANARRNDIQDLARNSSDLLARQLRNLASPTSGQPQVVDAAGAYDIVFRSIAGTAGSGSNAVGAQRVRWCLDATTSPGNEQLWTQTQTWTSASPPAVPSTAACPGSGWTTQRIAVNHLTNRIAGKDRPLLSYDTAAVGAISEVHVDLYVDWLPGTQQSDETHISSGVFLRNENRPPVAAFTAAGGNGVIVLNASASADPEGQLLTYAWLDGTRTVGSGITLNYAVTRGSAHTMSVTVTDPGGLSATSAPSVVTG